jgi:glycosyltransferase involved in cell wall biosynthesis
MRELLMHSQVRRICLYTDTFFPLVGGAEMVLHNLATRLTADGQPVVMLAPYIRRRDNRVDASYPIYRYAKPTSKRFGARQILVHLTWLYWRHRFQVLHCHSGYPSAYVGATFKRLFGIPLVVRPHGCDVLPGDRIRQHPRLERRLRRALAAADAVVAQGHYLKEVILELGVEEKRIHMIHNGVDVTAFASGTPFPHPRPYILSVGKLKPHKGFDILLRAYARLPHPPVDLLIAGRGRLQELQELAQQLGLGQRVRFVGFVEGQEKINLYHSAAFFVCPSRREPFANVILEALAAGVPVVASAVGGNPELVHHGQHGLLFPAEDDKALADTLHHLIEAPALLARLRANIPTFIRQFDWPVIAARYLELYRNLKRPT